MKGVGDTAAGRRVGLLVVALALVILAAVYSNRIGPERAGATNNEMELYPFLVCLAQVSPSEVEVHFGALNPLAPAVNNPSVNAFFPSQFDPPTSFPPGITNFVVDVTPDALLSWTLGANENTVSIQLPNALSDPSNLCPSGPQGPIGPAGPQGLTGLQGPPGPVSGYARIQSPQPLEVAPRRREVLHIPCPGGKVPLSGGWNVVAPRKARAPAELGSFPEADGWAVRLGNRSQKRIQVVLYALCATGDLG